MKPLFTKYQKGWIIEILSIIVILIIFSICICTVTAIIYYTFYYVFGIELIYHRYFEFKKI